MPRGSVRSLNAARPTPSQGTDGPSAAATDKLARLLAARTPQDGRFELRRRGTFAVRWSSITHEPLYSTKGPALCVIAQGKKMMMLGRETFEYDRTQMVANWVDLPIAGQVVNATSARPFLAFKLNLDPYVVAELAYKVYPKGFAEDRDTRGFSLIPSTDAFVDAVTRLVEAMDDPGDAEHLAPIIIEEILVRLLRSSIGQSLAQIGQAGSGIQRVASVVSWMRNHFAESMTVEQLADIAHMSESAFHRRFKAVTAMSPLQYHKVLRLHEARRLMLFQAMDASSACRKVGYLSASQFSREYARFFGSAPTRDITRLREEGDRGSQPLKRA